MLVTSNVNWPLVQPCAGAGPRSTTDRGAALKHKLQQDKVTAWLKQLNFSLVHGGNFWDDLWTDI